MTQRRGCALLTFCVAIATAVPAASLAMGVGGPPVAPQRLGLVVTRVVDGDGEPIEGAEVRLVRCLGIRRFSRSPSPLGSNGIPSEPDGSGGCDVQTATTRADGTASFPSVRVGDTTIQAARDTTFNYLLRAAKDDYTRARRWITPHVARNDFELIMYPTAGERMFELVDQAQEAEAGNRLAEAEADMIEAVAMMKAEFSVRGGQAPDVLLEAMRYLAYLQITKGDDIAARESLDRVLDLVPDDPYALRSGGVLAVQLRQWEVARAHFEAYVESAPDDADSHLLMGNLLLETGAATRALDHLEQAVALDAEHAALYRSLGTAYERVGRLPEAISSFERYLELADNPTDAEQVRSTIALLKRMGGGG